MLFAPFPSLFGKNVLPFGDSGSQFQTRADIPAGCRQVISPPPSLSPVTHHGPCAGFKTRLGMMYNGTGIAARWTDLEQRHFSPNPPILPGSKSVWFKKVIPESGITSGENFITLIFHIATLNYMVIAIMFQFLLHYRPI